HSHAERLVQVEVIDAKHLDAVLDGREEPALDAHALRGNLVARAEALEPVEKPAESERQHHDHPLPGAVDDGRVARKEGCLDLRLARGFVRDEVRVAEAALDGRSLDCLSADWTDLGLVVHSGLYWVTRRASIFGPADPGTFWLPGPSGKKHQAGSSSRSGR